MFSQRHNHLGCGAQPCPVVCPLEPSGTSHIQHGAAPASPRRGCPAAPHCQHLGTSTQYNIISPSALLNTFLNISSIYLVQVTVIVPLAQFMKRIKLWDYIMGTEEKKAVRDMSSHRGQKLTASQCPESLFSRIPYAPQKLPPLPLFCPPWPLWVLLQVRKKTVLSFHHNSFLWSVPSTSHTSLYLFTVSCTNKLILPRNYSFIGCNLAKNIRTCLLFKNRSYLGYKRYRLSPS